jgi:regulation of enolase protein 1 (concanavalin A-like superfamily)
MARALGVGHWFHAQIEFSPQTVILGIVANRNIARWGKLVPWGAEKPFENEGLRKLDKCG